MGQRRLRHEREDLSSSYRIFETKQFQADLRRISTAGEGRLIDKLQKHVYPQLRERPHFGPNIKKLKSWTPETWRYRIGSWRFFYEIDEEKKIVFIIAADHRSSGY